MEEIVVTKTKQFTELLATKEACDRVIEEKETERINSYEELYQKEKELETAMGTINDLKRQLQANNKDSDTPDFSEFKKKCDTFDEQLNKVQTELSLKEQKLEETQSKNDELNAEMILLKSERKNLNKSISDLTDTYEKETNELKENLKAKDKKGTDKSALRAAEKEKKEMGKKIKLLESTLTQWESRQFTNVKLISGLEKERDTLQHKLKEMKVKHFLRL